MRPRVTISAGPLSAAARVQERQQLPVWRRELVPQPSGPWIAEIPSTPAFERIVAEEIKSPPLFPWLRVGAAAARARETLLDNVVHFSVAGRRNLRIVAARGDHAVEQYGAAGPLLRKLKSEQLSQLPATIREAIEATYKAEGTYNWRPALERLGEVLTAEAPRPGLAGALQRDLAACVRSDLVAMETIPEFFSKMDKPQARAAVLERWASGEAAPHALWPAMKRFDARLRAAEKQLSVQVPAG